MSFNCNLIKDIQSHTIKENLQEFIFDRVSYIIRVYIHTCFKMHTSTKVLSGFSSVFEDPEWAYLFRWWLFYKLQLMESGFSSLQFYHHLKYFYCLHMVWRRGKRTPKEVYISFKLLSSSIDHSDFIKIVIYYT